MPRSSQLRQRSSKPPSRVASPAPTRPGLLPSGVLEDSDQWARQVAEVPALSSKTEELAALREYLQTLGKRVNELGGWLDVVGRNQWKDVAVDPARDPKADFETYLFPMLKHAEFQSRYKGASPVDLQTLKPASVVPIPVFHPPASGQLTSQFWEDVMSQDVAILRGFVKHVWKFDHSLFTIDYLEQHHGDFQFEVLVQDRAPDSEGMKLRSGVKKSSSIAEYIAKMKSELETGPGTGPVPFGVNVDIGTWQRHIDELLEKLPKCLNFGSEEDTLRYIRLHVNGMTLPQIYLKVTGCWTGAHQENLSFAAVNINHGPADCQWWSLCPDFNAALRDDILKRLKFDPLKSETLWWPDENFLMSQGYKTYYGIQQPDDLVYVGPATMHWVKSLGATVNSAWNFGGKTAKHFDLSFQRDALNREMQFESLVQIHTLALDLINREMATLPIDLVRYIGDRLQKQFNSEREQMLASKLPSAGVFPGHLVRRCEACKLEILYAYAPCNLCSCALCIQCAVKHSHPLPVCSEMFTVACFERLMQRIEARCNGGTVDLYDPGLNLHFTTGEKQKTAEAWTSPYSGSPSCIYFDLAQPEPAAPEPPAKAGKRLRAKDAEGKSEGKKRRKVPEPEVAQTLTQDSHSKPYTRSMAKSESPMETEEVEEEHKPLREPQVEPLNTVSENPDKKPAGLKTMQTREIAGTEVTIAEQEEFYRIPKKVKVPQKE